MKADNSKRVYIDTQNNTIFEKNIGTDAKTKFKFVPDIEDGDEEFDEILDWTNFNAATSRV